MYYEYDRERNVKGEISRMNIGLIDVDSKIPNLALMKISRFHKKNGDRVALCGILEANQYDMIYASKIFQYTEMPILPERSIIGGVGSGNKIRLSDEIEYLMPDYELYGCDYSMGYTSRGCSRRCPYCVVPKNEGKFNVVGDIYQFWNGHPDIMIMDNAINTDEDHFMKILDN